jgi:hypothetical protein
MIATWIGGIFGIMSLAFAVYEHRQRTRLESVVRDTLRRLAGEMRVLYSNAEWADIHLRHVGYLFTEASPDLNQIKIKRETFDAARDATACARQLGLVHSHIRGIQQSLFKDTGETLPEIKSDDVRAAEAMLEASPKMDVKSPNTKAESTSLPPPSAPPLSSSNPQNQR